MALTRFRNYQLKDFDYKNSVRVATTTAVTTLAGGAPNTVDTISLAAGDRVLVKNQTTASQNGIYDVTTLGTGSNGTWTRSADANGTTGTLTSGATVYVSEGSTNGGVIYRLTTVDPITIGSTNQTWATSSGAVPGGANTYVQFNNLGSFDGNANLTWNGSTLSATLLKSSQSSGDEGGELTLAIPATNSTISANVTIDVYQNKLRIFEGGGTNRGAYIDLTKSGATAGTDLLSTLVNGNSNVIVNANSNVTISSAGTANVLTVTSTGANIAGTANVTGATALGSTLTVVTNVTSPRFISNVATGTAPFTVTSTTQVANLNVATAGTVTTAAQPNITSVGTLASLGVSGAVTASTLVSNVATGTAPFTVTSTTQVANLNVATAGSATTAGTVTTAAQPNITSTGTLTGLTSSSQVLIAYDGAADTGTVNNSSMLEIRDTGATSQPSLTFHRPAAYATKVVLDTDNKLYFGGWSAAVGGQAIVCGNITPGANVTYTLGTSTARWANIFGLASSAQYADLAEKYLADDDYPIGTVLMIGGRAEVTIAEQDETGIVGTVSENPGFIMNDGLEGENVVSVAYIGRVPCRVKGKIHKGEILIVGSTPGVAEPLGDKDFRPGCLVGKALESYNSLEEGKIEILVGRL